MSLSSFESPPETEKKKVTKTSLENRIVELEGIIESIQKQKGDSRSSSDDGRDGRDGRDEGREIGLMMEEESGSTKNNSVTMEDLDKVKTDVLG